MVYTVLNEDAAGYVNFEVTTDDGDRKLVTYEDLIFNELVRWGYPVLGTVATIQEAEKQMSNQLTQTRTPSHKACP